MEMDPNRDEIMLDGDNSFQLSLDASNKRYEICKTCDKNDFGYCVECSCDLYKKVVWSNSSCPLNKWGQETRDKE